MGGQKEGSAAGHRTEAFERFLRRLPPGRDMTLMVLKGHLLIEEQVRAIIDLHVEKPEAVRRAKLDDYQAICLAEAFLPLPREPWLWVSVKKLNTLRNEIAHKIEPGDIDHRIDDLAVSVRPEVEEQDRQKRLERTLWSMFERVSRLATPATTSPETRRRRAAGSAP